jgi:hypothetical protein
MMGAGIISNNIVISPSSVNGLSKIRKNGTMNMKTAIDSRKYFGSCNSKPLIK